MAYLPTALFVALRPLLPFWQAQYVQVFCSSLHHSASSLLVSAAPTSLPLLFSSLTLALSAPPCLLCLFFSLKLSADPAETLFSLLLFYQTTMGPGHWFLPGNDTADKLARWGALLVLSAISCSLFSYLLYSLFSWNEGVLSH